MTKRRPDGTLDFSADPAVSSELERGQKRQALQRMPADQRGRAARQARIDAQRNRRNIDMPADLEAQIADMANALEVPFSQLLCRLALEGLQVLDIPALESERAPSRSMRFAFHLPLPGLGSKGKGKRVR